MKIYYMLLILGSYPIYLDSMLREENCDFWFPKCKWVALGNSSVFFKDLSLRSLAIQDMHSCIKTQIQVS